VTALIAPQPLAPRCWAADAGARVQPRPLFNHGPCPRCTRPWPPPLREKALAHGASWPYETRLPCRVDKRARHSRLILQ